MSVKGFKKANGSIERYDYNELDNVPKEVICNPQVVLASGTVASGEAFSIDTGVTLGDLRQFKKFALIFRGKSNTTLSNVYFVLSKDVTSVSAFKNSCGIVRASSASYVGVFEHIEGTKYLRCVEQATGNPSLTSQNFLTGLLDVFTAGNENSSIAAMGGDTSYMNVFNSGSALIKDMDYYPDGYKLFLKSASTPTIEYDWAVIGVSKIENF